MGKLDEIRALREARHSSRGGVESRHAPYTDGGAGDMPAAMSVQTRVMESEDHRTRKSRPAGVATSPRESKFDRVSYQREYMRAWRFRKARGKNESMGKG